MSPLLAVAVVTVVATLAFVAHQWPAHTGRHRRPSTRKASR